MLVSQRAWPVSTTRVKRLAVKALKRVAGFGLAIVFIPWLLLFWLTCGLLDVARNRPCTWNTIDRYFTGNGVLTWLLAPFNLLLDVLCLPYRNRGIYTLDDLPAGHRAEIQTLIDAAERRDLVAELREQMRDKKRGMVFFQWYGQSMPAPIDVPEFSQPYRYIRTVGISIFNKRQSTGLHFGPLRITLRVLYNVNPINDPNVYITVGDHTHRWRDKPLFIFDDTLQHKSVNESDALRCCLFVDILRPSPVSWALGAILTGVRLLMAPVRAVFYKHWTFMK